MGAKILIELDNRELISPGKLIISKPALKLVKSRKITFPIHCAASGERLEAIDTPLSKRIAREQPTRKKQPRIVIYYLSRKIVFVDSAICIILERELFFHENKFLDSFSKYCVSSLRSINFREPLIFIRSMVNNYNNCNCCCCHYCWFSPHRTIDLNPISSSMIMCRFLSG